MKLSNNIKAIEKLVEHYNINDEWIIKGLYSLKIRYNPYLEKKILDYISYHTRNVSVSDLPFIIPTHQSDILGDLNLGYILSVPELCFCTPVGKLPMHTFIAGGSGFGKSNTALTLAEETYNKNCNVKIIDPKADDYVKLAQKYPDILLLNWKEIKFNIFDPPPKVPKEEWYQIQVGHISQNYNFWEGAESFLIEKLYSKIQNEINPTPSSIYHILNSTKTSNAKDATVKATIKSRLLMMNYTFDKTINTSSTMLECLHDKSFILNTSGLISENESWFSEFILLWNYMYRKYNSSKRDLVLYIFDEAQHRLFNITKEINSHKLSSPLISQLVDQCRALNIGICTLSQQPSSLLKSVINNSWLKIAFHLGSGSELKIVKEAMGLNDEQAEYLHYLEIGEAIVRTAEGHLDPYPVKFNKFIESPKLSNRDFEFHQKRLKDLLYGETILDKDVESFTSYVKKEKQSQNEGKTTKEKDPAVNLKPNTSSKKPKPKNTMKTKTQQRSEATLSVWLNQEDIFLTQGQIFEKAGITSGSAQISVKKYMIREEYVMEHRIQVKRNRVSILEPTKNAYKLVGISKKKIRTKGGGYLHSFIAHHIVKVVNECGAKATIEYQLSNGKLVDVGVFKNSNLILYEVVISKPYDKEVSNALKNFNSSEQIKKLVFVVMDKSVLEELKILIGSCSKLNSVRDKIVYQVAGEFIQV